MNWLELIKSEMLEITKPVAYEHYPAVDSQTEPYYNPRFAHVTQAEKEALKLLNVYTGDRDIVLASVWIHDRFKPLFSGEDHCKKAADWVLEHLESKGFPKEKVRSVEYAVRNHGGLVKQKLDTLEAQILWDADKISHTGPTMFFNNVLMFTSKNISEGFFNQKYEHTVALDNIMSTIVQWKREINYNEPNPYHLEESRKIAMEKAEALNSFIEALQRQL